MNQLLLDATQLVIEQRIHRRQRRSDTAREHEADACGLLHQACFYFTADEQAVKHIHVRMAVCGGEPLRQHGVDCRHTWQ